MNKNDLYALGDMYGNILNQVTVVAESTGPGDTDLNKGTKLQEGGPKEKGGFKKHKLDPNTVKGNKDNAFDIKRFSYPDDAEECCDEDEEVMVEAVQHVLNYFSESANPDTDVISMIVEMGRASIPNLRTVIHNLNKTNKTATANLIKTITENENNPLFKECKDILVKTVEYDRNQKQPINEKRSKRALNNNNMKKTSFDKIFEAAMAGEYDELDELGVDTDTNDEFGELGSDLESDFDEGETDQVTITLDKATAQSLCDMIQAALGSGEDLEGDEFGGDELEGDEFGGDELEGDEFADEDEERVAGGVAKGEGIPAEAGVPKQHSASINYGKQNKVSNLKPGGAASAKGEGIPAAAGVPKQHSASINYGKQNKVSKLAQGKRMFD
jgi:hypothetical protein